VDNGRRLGRAAGGAWPPARLPGMDALADPVERVAAETGFSGVVRVDRDGEVRLAKAYGLAHRGWGVANTIDIRFAIASAPRA
jgi:CubicO group peptidase (beta-lactamase class C family)